MDTLPTEALAHLITVVLSKDMRDLCVFIINRRIYTLADALWRQIARASLIFKPPESTFATFMGSMEVLNLKADTRIYLCTDTSNRSDDVPYTGPIVIGARVAGNYLSIDICGYSCTYKVHIGRIYNLYSRACREIYYDRHFVVYTTDKDTNEPRSQKLLSNLETLVQKVFPEIVPYMGA